MPYRLRTRAGAGLSAAALACAAGTAHATWSIVIVDMRTREVAVASATCLTGFDLHANTPVVVVGVGGATAQSAVDSDGVNRTMIRDGFYAGLSPDEILAVLAVRDSSHQSRQYGMVDTLGRAVTFSGTQDGAWAGGRTGQSGDLVYAVQGNVLTGPPVVDAAVEAILTTPGDIAEKLMAAMDAARMMGGDGRCSCSSSNPPGCGSPPPSFTKSAHIAYMIVARIGDRDSSNGNYRALGNLGQMGLIDVNGDGLPDYVSGGASGIGVRPNLSKPGQPPILGSYSITPNTVALRGIAPGDFNADVATDLAFCDLNNDRVILFGGANGFAFAPGASFPTGDGPTALGVGDFNHDGLPDIANLNATALTVSVLLNTGGSLGPPSFTAVPTGTSLFQVGDLDADGDGDVVVASPTTKQIVICRNSGAGVLTAETPIALALQPVSLLLADINGDSLLDIVYVLTGEKQVRILKQNPAGDFKPLAFATTQAPTGVNIADVNADGFQDIVFVQSLASGARLAVMRGQEDGSFATAVTYPVGFSGTGCLVSDLNADGLPDALIPQPSGTFTVMTNSGGMFNANSGLAGGDYYLDFNIANQPAGAEDPVYQLRAKFDQWADSLVGVPDAVRSVAAFDPPAVWANGASVAFLTLHTRDRYDAPVAINAADVTVESLAGVPLGTVGAALDGPEGAVIVPITASTACASETFRVKIRSGSRTVTLMPDVTLVYTSPADLDRNLFVNGDDFDTFVSAFEAGDQNIDVNGDGFVNGVDFDYFLDRFTAGC